MIKNIHLFLIVFLILSASCGRRDAGFQQIRDQKLTVEIMKLQEKVPGDSTINFKFRISPSAVVQRTAELDKHFMYSMDSCFYLIRSKKKIFPIISQFIATGNRNAFEYFVVFDYPPTVNNDTLSLVYADRSVTNKSYSFKTIIN